MIKLITNSKEHKFDPTYNYITVGRNVDKIICDQGMSYFKVLGDASISRVHCQIENLGTCYVLRDLESSNGTFVNGRRLYGDRILEKDDVITIGRTHIAVEIKGEAKWPS